MKLEGNGVKVSFAAAPRSIVCVGCNGQYFASSLPIHQRSCFERNAFASVACPKCHATIRTGIYHAHVSACSGESVAHGDIAAARLGTPVSRHERNNPSELNSPEADGRIRCRCCDRAFHEDRIAKHQSVCVGQPPSRTLDRSRTAMGRYSLPANQTKPRRPQSTIPPSWNSKTLTDARARGSHTAPSICHEITGQTRQRHSHFSRDEGARCYDLVTRDSARQFGSSSTSGSGYPGASRMQAKRRDGNMNASSAGNPLVTNRMMTVSSVGNPF